MCIIEYVGHEDLEGAGGCLSVGCFATSAAPSLFPLYLFTLNIHQSAVISERRFDQVTQTLRWLPGCLCVCVRSCVCVCASVRAWEEVG